MFEKVNLTPLGIAVLSWLARNSDKEFYVREITEKVNGSLGGCHKVLKNLYDAGLLNRRESGRNVYYSANDRNPAIKHFKIFLNIHELHNIVQLLQNKSIKIVLFGSCALGEDTAESDIDILVLTHKSDEVRKILRSVSLSRAIAAVILSPTDFVNLKKRDKAFYSEVAKGTVLWDDSYERI